MLNKNKQKQVFAVSTKPRLGRKGMNGTYYAVCLLIGLIVGIVVVYFALTNGIMTDMFCAAAQPPVEPIV